MSNDLEEHDDGSHYREADGRQNENHLNHEVLLLQALEAHQERLGEAHTGIIARFFEEAAGGLGSASLHFLDSTAQFSFDQTFSHSCCVNALAIPLLISSASAAPIIFRFMMVLLFISLPATAHERRGLSHYPGARISAGPACLRIYLATRKKPPRSPSTVRAVAFACRGTASSGARTQRVLALIWTHATFNVPAGALPVCRANDPRSLSRVTGGDALQASTAVPFDEMAKAGFSIERPSIIISNQGRQLIHHNARGQSSQGAVSGGSESIVEREAS
ncbi:hypothetical protein [Bradyrhizobium sp. 169]|uniref:hypothetical protein n=1 Tax=Bradyrhizobium sp. 169 TaxID=2782640 RepID=UPI001FFBE338|nr:hypothetical protein [Bradyrhizobium sp. 169]MCK1589112.1 hypothetical protein [Bradyrhizobium sp. 169]